MTTTTFEFGYLFGGVENISFNDKIAAITQAHKQGYSYVVERRETFAVSYTHLTLPTT